MAVVCEGQIEEIHIGDVGTDFQVTIKECVDGKVQVVDVSGATTLEIIFERGDKTVVTKTATFVTDGTDGKIRYVSETGFLNSAGDWRMQGKTFGIGGWSGRSSIVEFTVYGNLDD